MRKLVALACLAVMLPAARASANDFYVTSAGGGDCSQAAPCQLQEAILGADSTVDELDRIHVVGALARTSPVNLSNSPIELIGSGSGSGGTFIHPLNGSGAAIAVGSGSAVRDVQALSNDDRAFQVASGATLANVVAQTNSGSAAPAIEIAAGAGTTHISDSTVTATGATGITAAGAFELTRSTIAADRGVEVTTSPEPSRVERSKISAARGLLVTGAHVTVASSLLVSTTALEAIFATGSPSSGTHTLVDVRGSTIRHTGSAGAVGVRAGADDISIGVARGEVTVRSSIVRGFDKDLQTDTVSGPGRIAIDHSDYSTTQGAGIENGGANVDLDPHWIDPATGNYGLAADSPLIDIGGSGPPDAAEASTDFAGLARILDGNGDGVPARDMGAFEFQAPVASFTATPETTTVGEAVTFDAGASSYVRGEITRYEWDLDGNGTFEIDQGTRTMTHTYTEPGTVTVALRVTGPDGARGRATRTVTVQPAAGPGPGPGPGPDVTAPVIKFTGGGTLVLGRSRVLKVKLRCAAGEPEACAGPLRLQTAGKVVKLASKRFRIAPGKTATVKLGLSKAKVKLIKKRKVKRVRAIATPRDKAGNSKAYSRTYRLKLAKKRRR